jgi:predicted DNA-binding antitoxin AbrB/MazE fold protein
MTEIITAVYENGVLRPTRPLALRERETVRIQIVSEPTTAPSQEAEAEAELDRIIQELVQAGILTPPPGRSDVEPLSEAERELADRLGRAPGKPLSEIIIEDRGGLTDTPNRHP